MVLCVCVCVCVCRVYESVKSYVAKFFMQVIEMKLPRDFDYHKVPAPWIQIKLLKILAILGADDQK